MMKFSILLLTLLLKESVSSDIQTVSSDIHSIFSELDLKEDFKPRAFENTINKTVQQIRDSLPDSLSIDLTIPTLNFDNTLIKGSLDVADPVIVGLNTFLVPNITFGLIGMKLNITFVFPTLEINPQYNTDVLVLTILPIYGNGTASIRLNNLTLNTYLELKTSPLSINNLHLVITLGSIETKIEGLLYDEEYSVFASGVLTSLANTFIIPYINDNAEKISNVISPILQEAINDILNGGGTTTSESTTTSPTTQSPTTASTSPPTVAPEKFKTLLENALPNIF